MASLAFTVYIGESIREMTAVPEVWGPPLPAIRSLESLFSYSSSVVRSVRRDASSAAAAEQRLPLPPARGLPRP